MDRYWYLNIYIKKGIYSEHHLIITFLLYVFKHHVKGWVLTVDISQAKRWSYKNIKNEILLPNTE